ncbi:MAG: hypothetical protein H0T46_33400 [Deltaproteobacteria bacterium]|nr:hypothetical protein [Deltaproteobacteria bacterium]
MRLSRFTAIVPDVGGVIPAVAFQRYTFVDRGSYEFADDVPPPPGLTQIASELTDRDLRVLSTRLLRLVPGDYLLAHHDSMHDDHQVEVVLDLSHAPTPGAEVRYRRGRGAVFFVVPSMPGAAAIVERDPTTQAYHTYISKLHPDASVLRLVMRLTDT